MYNVVKMQNERAIEYYIYITISKNKIYIVNNNVY